MIEFYKTDLGLVLKNEDLIQVKSTYVRKNLTLDEFNNSNPVKLKKHKYSEELNKYFNTTSHEWEYLGTKFKKINLFNNELDITKAPIHNIGIAYLQNCRLVMYHDKLYYTFFNGNYYPQMQLIDFKTKQLIGKWTNVRNLALVFNKDKKIIV